MFTTFRQYMTLNIVLSVVVLGALTLAACQAIAPAIPEVPTVPAGAKAGDLIDVQTCAFQPEGSDTIYEAECSTLIVPENWTRRNTVS